MAITDIKIYESGDGGDLQLKASDLETISGFSNQAYLALFGGVADNWWGNELIDNESGKYISTFQRELRRVALNSNGITRLENAAKKDLEYLQEYADMTVEGSVTGVRRFELSIKFSFKVRESQRRDVATILVKSEEGQVWILADGVWNDTGVWIDTAQWNDG